MKHLFIVNPAAGKRDRTAEVSAKAAEMFSKKDDEYEIYVTRGPMDAPEKIKRAADETGELRVYSCGGDGTYNECVCGAAGLSNVAVTPYATGTGNDFIRMFGADMEVPAHSAALFKGDVVEKPALAVHLGVGIQYFRVDCVAGAALDSGFVLNGPL